MFNSKYSKFITATLIIAIIAMIALIGYFGYDIYRKYYKNKGAGDAVDSFQDQYFNRIPNNNTNNNNTITDGNFLIPGFNQIPSVNTTPGNNTSSGKVTTVKPKYQGFVQVGTIEISKINLKQPVLEEVSDKALDTATCLLYGKLNEIGNSVIIGHNYRNGTLFSNLKKITNNDKIVISDYTGKKVTYTVYSVFETRQEDTSFYQRDTNGKREITLSTCTDNNDGMRTIILAKEN